MYIKDKMVIDSVAKAVMSVMDEENKKLLLEPEKGEKHEDEAEDKKLIKKMVKKSCHAESKGNQPQETFTDNNMGEMTDDQMKERERIVKGMKKGIAGFKERYGERAKDVMYATATKKAMGEDDHKGNKINPKEFEDKLDKKYGKPSPCVGDVKEAVEKPTHILSKELLSDHKRWMDSEGFDTHTVPLPKSHPKHATHVGIVAKNNNEAGYHEDGFARPIHESSDLVEGSGSKEKQKTPYRNINSPEYRASAEKQKDKMDKDEAATPGKKLLSRLKGGQYKLDKNQNGKLDAHDFKLLRGEKNESVEVDEADQLTMRGLHTANPQSIPSYMRSTEKGKKSLADKNRPILKQIIKGQLGKHPKPNLPEEVEELDELSKGTLLSYIKKADKQQGKNFDDIVAAHKDNDQPKATKANAKYINRERGQDRAVSKMYAKYDKPKTKRVLQFEGLDEKLNPKKRTTDALTGRVKGGDDNEHSSYKVALEDENIEAPKSRARSLAIEAFRKIKKESMLGQVGTSEEKKK